ncbi:MAG: type II toxin-antitoxin system VapC family toxin [Verrucomicrobiales bacterium]
MTAYPDTSFLCAFYRLQYNSTQAASLMQKATEPLSVSTLLLFEFRHSTRLQVWLNQKDRTRGFTAPEGVKMLAALQSDLSTGVLKLVAADWADVHAIAERLSAQYCQAAGHRALDTMHVATALHFGAKAFLTFDANQRRLAKAEKLEVKP